MIRVGRWKSWRQAVTRCVLFCISLLMAASAQADDWPQWLGPLRDSTWREQGVVERLPESGPVVRWRVPVDGGFAGPAVANQRVYVTDYVTTGDKTPDPDKRTVLQGIERVLCLDAANGALLWKHEENRPYEISYPAGPRTTPTVDDGRVYTLGAEGDLLCLDSQNGTLIWSHNFKQDYNAPTPMWGFCGHPLVDGERLICIVGGPGSLVVAFHKLTGKELWRGQEAKDAGYSAPTIIESGGTRQLLVWHPTALISLNPENGELYWSEPLEPNYGMSIVTPRMSGNLLFVGGIVHKSMMLELDPHQPAARLAWQGAKDVGIDPVHSTPYAEDGILYGVDREGQLSAVQMDNGKILWSTFALMPDQRRAQSGTVFLVKHQDRYWLTTDSGELVAARLNPSGYQELSRSQILDPTGNAFGRPVVWSHPAFAEQCLFARNDKELICISLAAHDYPQP